MSKKLLENGELPLCCNCRRHRTDQTICAPCREMYPALPGMPSVDELVEMFQNAKKALGIEGVEFGDEDADPTSEESRD